MLKAVEELTNLFRLSTVGRAEKPRVIKVPACSKARLR